MVMLRHKCDFCSAPAVYDGKTTLGPWGFMCERHFSLYGIKVPGLYSRLDAPKATTKVCSICGKEKPISEFYRYEDRRGVERYRNECKSCNLAERKRRYCTSRRKEVTK